MNNQEEKIYLGGWLTRPDLGIVEAMAKSGYFDWLAIDIEHNAISISQVEDMARVIQLAGVEAYVRLSDNDPILIKRILDIGVDGVIVPMVKTAEEVKKIKQACYYPPKGKRSVGLSRAQKYNPQGFLDYKENSEPKIKIIIQIEHIEAVRNIDSIFSQKDIFGYFIGPYDMSSSLGKPGDFKCEEMVQALKKVKQAGIRHNIRAGCHVINPEKEELLEKKEQGYKIIAVSTDMLFFLKGMNSVFKN